jgi:parallel beta-helix repeat protein
MKRVLVIGALILSILVLGLIVSLFANGYSPMSNPPTGSEVDQKHVSSNADLPDINLIPPTTPPPGSIVVPDSFSTINEAVTNAVDGQAIFVRAGNYNESVVVSKPLWLIGENQTVIDAHSLGADIIIQCNNVNLTGFTLQNTPTPATGTWLEQWAGIGRSKQLSCVEIINSSSCNIYSNRLSHGLTGVNLTYASKNNIVMNYFESDGSGWLGGDRLGGETLTMYGNGIAANSSASNRIANNTFIHCGMSIANASNSNWIANNAINGSGKAIAIDSSQNNWFRNNTLNYNMYSFEVVGSTVPDYQQVVDSSNTIEGKPIYYWIHRTNDAVPSDAAYIVLVNCINITVENPVLSMSSKSLVLVNTTASTVKGCTLQPIPGDLLKEYATPMPPLHIMLFNSQNNQLVDNQATIWVHNSSSNYFTHNTARFHFYYSDNNKIISNDIRQVGFASSDWAAVDLIRSNGNLVKQNIITKNYGPGVLLTDGSSNNQVIENQILSNVGGIKITAEVGNDYFAPSIYDPSMPSNNVIFGNTLDGNQNQGIFESGYCTQIIGNTLTKNGNCALQLSNSQNTTIVGNVIYGMWFGDMGNNTRNVQVIANNITFNYPHTQYAVWLVTAYPAIFYHNNFFGPINFSHYAGNYINSTVSDAVSCIWDDGSRGNYWSSYSGVDDDGNGVGDTPFSLGFGYYDNYPLMTPYDISSTIPSPPT